MTREELEAGIWRRWPSRQPGAAQAVDGILLAADAYAARTATLALRAAAKPRHPAVPADPDAAAHRDQLERAVSKRKDPA